MISGIVRGSISARTCSGWRCPVVTTSVSMPPSREPAVPCGPATAWTASASVASSRAWPAQVPCGSRVPDTGQEREGSPPPCLPVFPSALLQRRQAE